MRQASASVAVDLEKAFSSKPTRPSRAKDAVAMRAAEERRKSEIALLGKEWKRHYKMVWPYTTIFVLTGTFVDWYTACVALAAVIVHIAWLLISVKQVADV